MRETVDSSAGTLVLHTQHCNNVGRSDQPLTHLGAGATRAAEKIAFVPATALETEAC